ncbi:Uncharacterized protein APZ42_013428 [Daphnia magna]|uniref:Uncharacterized protein n=1 Tax=Daphnia magna TaxID=35525 RepID=A0A162QYZ4_9CRUS|nr:Uncharacterized protein APZ42_013428 [Daphnia magna]
MAGVDEQRKGAPAAPREAIQHVSNRRAEHERLGHRMLARRRKHFAVDGIVANGLDIDFEPLHAEIGTDEIDHLSGSRLRSHRNHFHAYATWRSFVGVWVRFVVGSPDC